MNLETKIAALLIVGFKGAEINSSSPILRDIRSFGLGGVILFDKFLAEQSPQNNILSLPQTQKLVNDLQQEADGTLLIAVDQEGGKVNRFKEERGFPTTLSAKELGCKGLELSIQAAGQTAQLLSELGVNLNLAPVVDLDIYPDNPIIGNYSRSFSADPAVVSEHAEVWIRAHRANGIRTCLKHFPGHGSSRHDSHLGFVDISTSWTESELIPYRNLLKNGMVDTVMTGHLFNRALDSEYPATLSSATVSGLLREKLGFEGPVISDDMQMRAITSHYDLKEAVCKALAAGVDLLVFGNNLDYDPDIVQRVVHSVKEAVHDGHLPENRIDQAWSRVRQLKQLTQQHKKK